jgi:hypothetical protein
MATAMASRSETRPRPILYAVVLMVINAVGGPLFGALAPDVDDRGTVIVVRSVLGLIMLAVAAWLWMGSRWGAWASIAINVFNILLAIPAYFAADGVFMAGATISILLSLGTIWFIWTPEAKAFWKRA